MIIRKLDKISKVIELFDMSCDCECCLIYTDYYVHLDCWHWQSVSDKCKVWEKVFCEECNQEYEF